MDRLLPEDEMNNSSQYEDLRGLNSNNGKYRVEFGTDGNLVMTNKESGATIWQSNTAGRVNNPTRVVLQKDANLVMYDQDGKAYWATNTGRRSGGDADIMLLLQNDGNLVLYHDGKALWKTDTVGR